MAALLDAGLPGVVDFRQLRSEQLDWLLEEEIALWRHRLEWDFRPSADLVRRFIRMQALNGYALLLGHQVVGYSYFVCEENKGLIGDLFVAQAFRSIDSENRLLTAVLDALAATPFVHRVESQLMMLSDCFERPLPHPARLQVYRRNFMTIDSAVAQRLEPGPAAARIAVDNWTERIQEESAILIAQAYHGHVDSKINDQYRSVSGARRFLTNIIQYPGCGGFFQPASFFARQPETRRLCGISLTSLIASDVGHITQVCVDPALKGTGIGYELLRRSLETLARHGCRKVSLTVTDANREAIVLYERMGFATLRSFAAYVWEGF